MDKYIYDKNNGLGYELVGDYERRNHLCISSQ